MDLHRIVDELDVPSPPEVIVGLGTSDDAGVYRIGPDLSLVLTADFITPPCDDPFLYGQIAAANSLSDVYAMGGTPKAVLNLCCFPTRGIAGELLTEIMRGGLEVTTLAGAVLIGGHTVKDNELKYGLSVTGIVRDADLKTNAGAKPGDVVILTKRIGTGVIVNGLRAEQIDWAVAHPVLKKMAELNKSACEAMLGFDGTHGVTDITGFGLAGHSFEVAQASSVGVRFRFADIPRWTISEQLIAAGASTGVTASNAQALDGKIRITESLDPIQRSILFDPQTSGGLLITIDERQAQLLLNRLIDMGIEDAAICGEVFATDEPHLEIVL